MAFPLQFLLETVLPHILMGKGKKKHSKKGKDELSDDILSVAAMSVKKFRKVTKEISKLSMGQKVVGGVALLAAGLTYLAANQQSGPATPIAGKLRALVGWPAEPDEDTTAEEVAAEPADADEAPPKSRKPRKSK